MEIWPMKNIYLLLILLSIGLAYGTDTQEEAIILNQELQFLQESAAKTRIQNDSNAATPEQKRSESLPSLEETYFGSEDEDSVTTRSAARKRIQN